MEGLAFAAMTNDGKTQYGVIDDKGAWVVSPSYDEVRSYCEDLAAVKIAEKWGYIDTAGTMAITPAYSNAYDFSGGWPASPATANTASLTPPAPWLSPTNMTMPAISLRA